MEDQKCLCGKPAHPAYGDKCEDCWVLSSDGMEGRRAVSSKFNEQYAPGTMSVEKSKKRRIHNNKKHLSK